MSTMLDDLTDAERAELDVERFVVDTQFRLHQLLKAKGVKRSELALRLGMSKARVSAMFGARPNLTLETLARVLVALGEKGVLSSPAIDARIEEIKQQVSAESPVAAGNAGHKEFPTSKPVGMAWGNKRDLACSAPDRTGPKNCQVSNSNIVYINNKYANPTAWSQVHPHSLIDHAQTAPANLSRISACHGNA